MRTLTWMGLAAILVFGCNGDDTDDERDAGGRDAGGVVDAGTRDGGAPRDDAGTRDAGTLDAGREDACVGETSEQLCAAASAACGNVVATDRCGAARTLDCGGCPGAQACGARGVANVCGYERWDVSTVDADGDPGHALSMAIDGEDVVWLAYRAEGAAINTLRAARLEGGSWIVEDLDSGWLVGVDTAIAIDPSGGVHVAAPGPVRTGTASYAELFTRGAGGWTRRATARGSSASVGLAFDAAGRAQLCAYDPPSGGFGGFLVHLAEQGDGTFTTATIDGTIASSESRAGDHCSIAVDGAGTLHAAYYDGQWMRLEHASRAPAGSWTIDIVDEPSGDTAGRYAFMALDPSDRPQIVYAARLIAGPEIRRATLNGTWSIETIDDAAGTIANYPSIAFDSSGAAHVVYFDSNGGTFYYAYQTASGWTREVLDVVGTGSGGFSAIGVDSTGTVHVGYYDTDGARLRHAVRVAP